MKQKYINPQVLLISVAEEDVIRTSPVKLGEGEYGMEDIWF